MRIGILAGGLTLLFTGCMEIKTPSLPSLNPYYLYPLEHEDLWQRDVCYERFFNVDIESALSKMVRNIPQKIGRKVAVSDFVNIVNLRTDTKLGFLLSDQFKTILVKRRKLRVIELKLAKNFSLGRNGITILTNRAKDLKERYQKLRYVIVGDYFLTSKRIFITIKMIDLDTQEIVFSDHTELPLTCELYDLSEGSA